LSLRTPSDEAVNAGPRRSQKRLGADATAGPLRRSLVITRLWPAGGATARMGGGEPGKSELIR
jgi:hypothetical protein